MDSRNQDMNKDTTNQNDLSAIKELPSEDAEYRTVIPRERPIKYDDKKDMVYYGDDETDLPQKDRIIYVERQAKHTSACTRLTLFLKSFFETSDSNSNTDSRENTQKPKVKM